MPTKRILLVCGSTRSGSTNTAALRAVQEISRGEVTTVLYERIADLPRGSSPGSFKNLLD